MTAKNSHSKMTVVSGVDMRGRDYRSQLILLDLAGMTLGVLKIRPRQMNQNQMMGGGQGQWGAGMKGGKGKGGTGVCNTNRTIGQVAALYHITSYYS